MSRFKGPQASRDRTERLLKDVGCVVVLTLVNMRGVTTGKNTQNFLTLAKVVGLAGLVAVGLLAESNWNDIQAESRPPGGSAALALVLVFYAYGGWNDAVLVTSEVRHRQRTMPLALGLGVSMVLVIYLLVNVAYLRALGFEALQSATVPAAEVLRRSLGPWGEKAMCLLVMVSALGAVQGMMYAGSRLYARLANDHRLFKLLGHWNAPLRAPVCSLLVQAAVCLGLILIVGTQFGQRQLDVISNFVIGRPLPWTKFEGGFELLVATTAPVFWTFLTLTGFSLFVLRRRDEQTHRPFRVPLYPLVPAAFVAICVFMLYSSALYARGLLLLSAIPVLTGFAVCTIERVATKRGS